MFARWSSPEAVFQIMKECTADTPCDIRGIESYATLDECGGVQWPAPPGSEIGPRAQRRLFEDGVFYHPNQRARFVFDPPTPLPEPTREGYPFTLLTGRSSSAHWHTQTRTSKSAVLRKLAPQTPYVEIHPDDALALGIQAGQSVRVRSQRGDAVVQAVVTPTVQRGHLFMPMHYESTNRLTFAAFDPHSRQPAYKACAVALERIKR